MILHSSNMIATFSWVPIRLVDEKHMEVAKTCRYNSMGMGISQKSEVKIGA
jgi:hypothetical protein